MKACYLCKKRYVPGNISFFSVSKDGRREKWSKACGIEIPAKGFICIEHFSQTDYRKSGRGHSLMPNAIPSLKLSKSDVRCNRSVPTMPSVEAEYPTPMEVVYSSGQFQEPNQMQNLKVISSSQNQLSIQALGSQDMQDFQFFNRIERVDTGLANFFTTQHELVCTGQLNQISQFQETNEATQNFPIAKQFYSNREQSVENMGVELSFPTQEEFIFTGQRSDDIFSTENHSFRIELSQDLIPGTSNEHCSSVNEIQTTGGLLEPRTKEQCTQTDPVILDYTVDRQNFLKKTTCLENKIKELEINLAQANAAIDTMRSIFTEGQIRKLKNPSNIKWKWPDISSAICLHASGPRAYKHLYNKGYPLPHVSTLQRWCRKVNITEGKLTVAIDFMSYISDLSNDDKICVLSFDEMKVEETFEYDKILDTVRKPANYVQVVMARGLRKSWKQPIFFDFDRQMTKEILFDLISDLHKIHFPVVAIVCDMGPTNRKLWKDLDVSIDKPWFVNPMNTEEKIFTFADAPHLLKLIRNHFLDSGFVINNEYLTQRTIADVLMHTSKSDITITFKLSDEHLSVKGAGRQKVKLAAQLFSHTTANAIRRCDTLGLEVYKPTQTANFIQLVNDWFDILNSSLGTYAYPGKEPFGLALPAQLEKLGDINNIMSSNIVPNEKNLKPFQRGILITNKALVLLHKYVGEKFNMSYVCTNRLNQDILENFFGAIRSKGGLNDHPTPKEFKYRLRKYILARNTEHLSGTGNVGFDKTEWLQSNEANDFFTNRVEETQNDLVEEDGEQSETDELDDLQGENFIDMGTLQVDALEYICGYIIRKLQLDEYKCEENSQTWVDQLSKGSLVKPSSLFVEKVKILETIFKKKNKTEVSHFPQLLRSLVEASKDVDLPEKVRSFYFKCRIHFRVRHLNKRLKVQKAKQRIMGHKKMIKIKL